MKRNGHRFLWKNREDDLKQVKRFHGMLVMFYRTDLLIHSRRVGLILESLLPVAMGLYPDLDAKKARLIAKHHDDYELQPIGDVPLQLKLKMNGNEMTELVEREIAAAEEMARNYPKKVGGYDYLSLLLHAIHKNCPEAQLVSLADKYDAYCEALHEVLAGNLVFLHAVINYNTKIFNHMPGRYPLIQAVFQTGHPLFCVPVTEAYQYFDYGRGGPIPHNEETLARKIGIPVYEEWRRITLEEFGKEPLILQKEFHSQ